MICHVCLKVLDHFLDTLLPKSGMRESDRWLLKEKLVDPETYRNHSGQEDCSWMSRLQKSAIETFRLLEDLRMLIVCCSMFLHISIFPVYMCCEDLIYGRKFDNALRVSCKSNAVPEAVLEQENVQAEWGKILDLLKNEEIERKAAAQLMTQPDQGAGEQCEIELLRKPPSQHSEGSESYFKAIANQTVRTYCCFNPEPKTLEGMISWSSSVLQNFQGEVGQSCVLTHLDCDALGAQKDQSALIKKTSLN